MGRVAGVVELSGAERTFLESQVRRHRAPRSLSDRCQMILLCAEAAYTKGALNARFEYLDAHWAAFFLEA